MSTTADLSLEQICVTLFQMGTGERAVPVLQQAIRSLVERQSPGGELGLDDVLGHLRGGPDADVADMVTAAVHRIGSGAGISPAEVWRSSGRVPNTLGYNEAKWEDILTSIRRLGLRPYGFGAGGLDERSVEYPWIFERVDAVHPRGGRVLDAGSVMNFKPLAAEWTRRQFGPLSIVTLCFEGQSHLSDAVRYEFADLRELPYRDGWFSTVLSVSTLEHVGMDTAIYGGDTPRAADPRAEMAKALREMDRVTAVGGTLLISVPFGEEDDRGWLRILGLEEVEALGRDLGWKQRSLRVFRAMPDGWREVDPQSALDAGYNEPHFRPGRQTAPSWVAAAEAVALLEFEKV